MNIFPRLSLAAPLATSLAVFLAMGLFNQAQAQETPQILPLFLENLGGAQRLVIYAGIDGSAPLPYLFDTGSSAFNAFYYDGPMSNGAVNNSDWANTGTNVADAHYSYGTADKNFGLLINEVTVTNISIYNPGTMTVAACLSSATGFSIGQAVQRITSTTDAHPDYTDRQGNNFDYVPFSTNQLSKGLPPEPVPNGYPAGGGLYGTFGAGLFADINSNSPIGPNFTNGSVLGQATKTGWAVIANNVGTNITSTNPYAILGLTDAITNQFKTTLDWITNSTVKFPNSGANSGKEFDARMSYTLSGGTNAAVAWTNATLLDSGTQNNTLTAADVSSDDLAPYTNNYNGYGDSVIAGNVMSIAGAQAGAGTYSFTTTQISDPVTYNATLVSGGSNSTSTLGIGFFLSNSVAFDLQHEKTLYTDTVVTTVPEPSEIVLFGLAGVVLFASLRRKTRKTSLQAHP